jgi:hypothetical protein
VRFIFALTMMALAASTSLIGRCRTAASVEAYLFHYRKKRRRSFDVSVIDSFIAVE